MNVSSKGIAALSGALAAVFVVFGIACADPDAAPVADIAPVAIVAPDDVAVSAPAVEPEAAEPEAADAAAPAELEPVELEPVADVPAEVAAPAVAAADAIPAVELAAEPEEEAEPVDVAAGALESWDTGVLMCGVNAKPALDQDIDGNWWAYCEPALVD